MGRHPIPVLTSLPVIIIVGTVLGFLTGLGIGGGSLLMVWLTAVLGIPTLTARGINLLFYLPGAIIAICFRKKQGKIQWRHILPPAIAGCAAAALCSRFSTAVDNPIFRTAFGIILIAAGAKELLWKKTAS